MAGRLQRYQLSSPFTISTKFFLQARCGVILMVWMELLGCQSSQSLTPISNADLLPRINSEVSRDSSESFEPIPLAIYPIKNLGDSTQARWVGPTLTELIMSDLSQWPHWRIISRETKGLVLREQWLQYQPSHSGALVRLGRLQGARFMVKGGFVEREGHVMVDLQIIDLETGVIWDTVRAEGSLENLPRLEQSLVTHLVERLPREGDTAKSTQEKEHPDSNEKVSPGLSSKKTQNGHLLNEFGNQLIVQEEQALVLEDRTRQRLKLLQGIENLFQQGLTLELGRPHHSAEFIPGLQENPIARLFVPVVLYAEEHRVRELIAAEISPAFAERAFDPAGSILPPTGQDVDQWRFFVEQMARPRRMFVRARSGQGEVIAVFSRWDWRTDRVFSFPNGSQIKMPWWPAPLFKGAAEFPVKWLNRGDPILTFDTTFVDVHQEEVNVAVEWVVSSQVPRASQEDVTAQEHLSRHLQTWIQDHWSPSLAETLPVKGYLPGNKQLAHLHLYVEQGVITHLDHQFSSSDPVFIDTINELMAQLLRACPWCMQGQDLSEILHRAEFRIQCTLLKPTYHTGLGTRIP